MADTAKGTTSGGGDAAKDETKAADQEDQETDEALLMSLGVDLNSLTVAQIRNRIEMSQTNTRIIKREITSVDHDVKVVEKKIKENNEKIKLGKKLPYLISNVVEVLKVDDLDKDKESNDGGGLENAADKEKWAVVIKTTTRQTYFLPVVGLVDPKELKPGDIVGVNKDSYLILDTLPTEYDSRIKAMEIDEKPKEDFTHIGGLNKQITELREAIVLPMTHADKFEKLGIEPPKGVLLYGPPGTGKTMIARATANATKAFFLKLAGPQLVQMFIGDGAKIVRDAFALAKEKAPSIIFIDELDAIGSKRSGGDKAGGREVQRTMLELLSQLDGFGPVNNVKVIAATNRPDILDPALMRSGRIDRKIECPLPDISSRKRIMMLHSEAMNRSDDINWDEIASVTEEFNGAQCKAIVVEAGMLALRRDSTRIHHADLEEAVEVVKARKKQSHNYFV